MYYEGHNDENMVKTFLLEKLFQLQYYMVSF